MEQLTGEEEAKPVRRNFRCLLPQTWWIMFLIHLDKSTLAQASIMGILKTVDMNEKTNSTTCSLPHMPGNLMR